MTANALKIIRQAGSTLYLAESTLHELHSHIHAADREYQNTYFDIEAHVDYALASQSDRILIRAYYYSKLNTANPKRPARKLDTLSSSRDSIAAPARNMECRVTKRS